MVRCIAATRSQNGDIFISPVFFILTAYSCLEVNGCAEGWDRVWSSRITSATEPSVKSLGQILILFGDYEFIQQGNELERAAAHVWSRTILDRVLSASPHGP